MTVRELISCRGKAVFLCLLAALVAVAMADAADNRDEGLRRVLLERNIMTPEDLDRADAATEPSLISPSLC